MGRTDARTDARAAARAAESLAARTLARLPELTDALVRTIAEHNPGYRAADVVPAGDLWRSCEDNLTRVLELVGAPERPGGGDPDTDPRYDAARATGQRRAEQRLPLDDVLRSFRLGGRLVWEALLAQAQAGDPVTAEVLLGLAGRVWEVVDTTSAQVAAAYHSTERRLSRADDQRRAAFWAGLLHGRARDAGFAHEVARFLDVPVRGTFAVVVLDPPADPEPAAARLPRTLAAAGLRSGWQAGPDGLLVGLVELTGPDRDLTTVLAGAGTGGVSLPVCGLAEVDTGYQQALLARRTRADGAAPELVALAERLPEALLLNSPALAEELLRRRLGDLLGVPAPERRLLLGTLRLWVASGGSIRDTAAAARCHRNTVLNRLQRIQAITGHDFAAPAHQVELALALRAATLLPGPDPAGSANRTGGRRGA
jgi:hypothetical protein